MNWKCPQCANVKRAPSAPHNNDVRRFCLPRTGFLVQRLSVARESARERARRALAVKRSLSKLKAAARLM